MAFFFFAAHTVLEDFDVWTHGKVTLIKIINEAH